MTSANASIIELPSLHHPDAWEDPIFFDEIDAPDVPTCVLPGVLGEFANCLAVATETPEALAVMVVLGVIATAAAKHFRVSPIEGWQEPLNIYTLIALPPANNKSLVLKRCIEPLVEWEKEQAILLATEIKRRCSERKSEEKIIEVLRGKMGKLQDDMEQKQLIREIANKEAALMEPPVLPKLFVNDATPESLAMTANMQGGYLTLFSDEGGIIETLGGLYSKGTANIDILLKGIDGGEIRICRKDRSYDLKPFLTIVLTVQPAVISSMSAKKAYVGNGALERFLYVLPKSKLGYRTHDKPSVPLALQNAYTTKIKTLLNHQSTQPQLLTLTPPAYQAWREF